MCKLGTSSIDYSFLLSNTLSLHLCSVILLHFFHSLLLSSLINRIPGSVEGRRGLLVLELTDDKVELVVEGGRLVKVTDLALLRTEIGTLLFLLCVSCRYVGLASNEVTVALGLGLHATHCEEVIFIL